MRLTLRTLLAYLDDTLDASEAKMIGQKVAESDAAQELIARIKQVTRRRRLTSPPAIGPGAKLDANLIAEYLDNVLTAEQLAEVEESALASDTHLAEVAACHQILTLVLGEPALVPPTARQRMYGLITGRESIPNRKASAPPIGQGAIDATAPYNDEADETLLLGLSLSRPGSWLRWLLPVLAAVLLLAAGAAIWKAVSPGVQGIVQRNNKDGDGRRLAMANPTPKEAGPAGQDETKKQPDQPGAADKKGDTEQKKAATPPQKADTEPKPAEAGKTGETTKKSEAQAPAKPEAKQPPPSPILPPAKERRDLARMLLAASWPSVLLERAPDKTNWQRLKPQSRVWSLDSLLSLPGYRTELLTESGVQLLLWGNLPQLFPLPVLESAIVLYHNDDLHLDFKLERGLVVLTSHREDGPARIRLRFHDEVWDLTLPDKTSEVAVQLTGTARPYTKETGGGEPACVLIVYVLKGKADLRVRYRQMSLQSPCEFGWDNSRGPAPEPQPIPRLPDWWASKLPPKTRDSQGIENAVKALASRLLTREGVDVVLGETLHDADPAGHVVGIHCLGALEDWSNLIDALAVSDEKRYLLRVVAIAELKYLLGVDARNDQKLLQALKAKNYTEGQAQTVLQLLHGFSEEDWANPAIRSTVVEYLVHERLAIRQLTHYMLVSLVPEGRKIQYDPAGDVDVRERGYAEWKKAVLNPKPPVKSKG